MPPFPQLLGTMTAAMAEVEEQLDEQQWRDNLRVGAAAARGAVAGL